MTARESFGGTLTSSNALAVSGTVRRLCDLLDEETLMLRSSALADLKDFNRRKQQGMLELDRALRAMSGDLASEVAPLLAALRERLNENLQVLGLHLEAMREVSDLMRRCIRRAQSDGTYGRRFETSGSSR